MARRIKRRSGGRGTVRRKSFAPKKRGIRKIVRREMSRQAETKSIQAFNFEKVLYPSTAVNFPNNVIELGPGSTMQIVQGTGNGNRIGNRIITKSLTFKGTIVPLPYHATTNPTPFAQQVKMIIFYDRTEPTTLPAPAVNLFQNGNANAGFNNDLVDMWRPFNIDRYRILASKTFKLGFAAYTGTGAQPGQQGLTNNDFKMNCDFRFNLTKYYVKRVKFDENGIYPQTRQLYCMFYMAASSGGQNSPAWEPCAVQYMQDYRYQDA